MVDREDVGSWLSGPPVGEPGAARGTQLGLPPTGSGSLATVGRRIVALVIDWLACLAITYAFFPGAAQSLLTLGIFAVENVVLVGTVGGTLGHRLLGLRVRRVLAPRSLVPAGSVAAAAAGKERPAPDAAGKERPAPDAGPDVPPGLFLALVRTALLCLVIPAVIWDADGRGLHDRFAATAIVRR